MKSSPLTCIIIEDEPIAADVLSDYIREVKFLALQHHFTNAMAANEYLKTTNIDVLFLDIHLPGMKGNEYLKTLDVRHQVIFTTAYSEYAVEGYELNVVDYLLKPFSMPRFLQAVNKLKLRDSGLEETGFEIFNENKKQFKIKHDEILYIESNRDYCKIHLIDRTLISTKITISEMQQRLASKGFRRIHKSYLVNESKIKMTSANEIMVNDVLLPLGRMFK